MIARIMPADCGPRVPPGADIIPYHYVVDGELKVKLEGKPPIALSAGQVILFPSNDEHLLGGDLTLQPTRGEEVVKRRAEDDLASIRLGGGGVRTRLVCGFLSGESLRDNPVVQSLPSVICLDMRGSGAADWVQSSFQYAATELARGRIGSETVLAKLSELLFVEAVRRYVETLPPRQTGWLAGLGDPYVGRALALLHRRPSEHWSVDSLGRGVGLSRSALADRFIQVIGVPPMQYLASWRMQLARQELLQTNKSLAQIAQAVGYASEAAFSRAFKRIVGQSPGTLRRERA